jgi:tetratricopeptide (TPR) repeat protein
MSASETALCGDNEMNQLLVEIGRDDAAGMQRLSVLMASFPADPRLRFLYGSLLAGQQSYKAAVLEMRQALELAPDFILARYQLGFLQLTMGEPYAAMEAWGPLHGLPQDNYIRVFVEGLGHLIRDEFTEALAALEKGIVLNHENAPMNNDIRLIIEQIRASSLDAGDGDQPLSAAQMLLHQAAIKNTRH